MNTRPSWMPASGIAPDRPLNPPDEVDGPEFDLFDEQHIKDAMSADESNRLVPVIARLLQMNLHLEAVAICDIRDAIRDLEDELKHLYEEGAW